MNKRKLSILVFIAYTALLIKIMVFKAVPAITTGQVILNFGGVNGGHPANFIPFATIWPYLMGEKGFTIAFLNLFGNIALLISIGFLAVAIYKSIAWQKVLVLAFAYGIVIEAMQTVLRVGIFDIDDVLLNALGVMIGYWIFIILKKWITGRRYIHILITTLLVITAAAGVFYAIYPREQPVISPGVEDERQVKNVENEEKGVILTNEDLCGGTGGTGEIVGQGDHTIDLKRNDGVVQTLKFTDQTEIKAPAGPIEESGLKIGDRVTVVVEDNETTSTVLVCN